MSKGKSTAQTLFPERTITLEREKMKKKEYQEGHNREQEKKLEFNMPLSSEI